MTLDIGNLIGEFGKVMPNPHLSDKDRELVISNLPMTLARFNNDMIGYRVPFYKPIAIIIKGNTPLVKRVFISKDKQKYNIFDIITTCINQGIFRRGENILDYKVSAAGLEDSNEQDNTARFQDVLETDNFMLVENTDIIDHGVFINTTKFSFKDLAFLCYKGSGKLSVNDEVELFKTLSEADQLYLSTIYPDYKVVFIPQLYSLLDFKLLNPSGDKFTDRYIISSRYSNEVNQKFSTVINDVAVECRRRSSEGKVE